MISFYLLASGTSTNKDRNIPLHTTSPIKPLIQILLIENMLKGLVISKQLKFRSQKVMSPQLQGKDNCEKL